MGHVVVRMCVVCSPCQLLGTAAAQVSPAGDDRHHQNLARCPGPVQGAAAVCQHWQLLVPDDVDAVACCSEAGDDLHHPKPALQRGSARWSAGAASYRQNVQPTDDGAANFFGARQHHDQHQAPALEAVLVLACEGTGKLKLQH